MKKMSVIVCCCLTMLSCGSETTLQLPEVEMLPAVKVENAASIYFFYDEDQPDSLRIGKKQDEPATNQVFYVDKRLLLRQITPQLQNKTEKTSSRIPVRYYFSVTDTKGKHSFLDFSETDYRTDDEFSKFYIKDFPEKHISLLTLTLNFKRNDEITVDGNLIERSELVTFLKNYIDFVSEGKQTLIYLNFDEDFTFGEYISNYDLIRKINSPAIKIAETQFIYNEALLPDCNCVL